ncbi:MAG: hypothetical protein IJP63_00265 [Acholeplasmatales bacterium]|nr:hypothetical protein [Acholeplasmatales bacterium]
MYHYVEDKEFLRRAQSACSSIMQELDELLRDDYGINTQFFLVGSGARNMVTQNADESIDYDYNLNVFNGFDYDERELKEDVRKALNKIMRKHNLRDVEDSTRSLTTIKMHFTDDPSIDFSMDICIVTKDEDGLWHRLKHEKTGYTYNDKYYWNKIPNSRNCHDKARAIKEVPGWWEVVRQHYLIIKNKYLTSNDYDHPSVVCYFQAVSDVYNQMRQKKIIK